MTRMVLAICGEEYFGEDGSHGWHVRRYAYVDDMQEGARVRDENYVLALVERLAGEGSTWVSGERPSEKLKRMFDVFLDVENYGKDNARYKVDYHKYDGCPSQAIDDGMDIYRAIRKHGTRPVNKKVKAYAEMKACEERARIAAEAARKKFEIGKTYYADIVDSLGHVDRQGIVWDGRKAKKVRKYDNGDEYVVLGQGVVYKAANVL